MPVHVKQHLDICSIPLDFQTSLGRMSSVLLELPPDFLERKILHTRQIERMNVEQLEKKSNVRHDIMSYSCPSVVVVFENPEQVGEYQIFVSEHIQV